MTRVSQLQELMFDWNSEFLLDLHRELVDRYGAVGLFVDSKSPDFTQCIIKNARFLSKINHNPTSAPATSKTKRTRGTTTAVTSTITINEKGLQ